LLIHLAATNTLPGLAQAVATLLAGTFGWILLIALMVGGLVCFFSRKHGAFAVDVIFGVIVAFFIFNPTGVTSMLQSAAKAL
jgi:tetrahydromethanopterin S-methyltransferase subunit E